MSTTSALLRGGGNKRLLKKHHGNVSTKKHNIEWSESEDEKRNDSTDASENQSGENEQDFHFHAFGAEKQSDLHGGSSINSSEESQETRESDSDDGEEDQFQGMTDENESSDQDEYEGESERSFDGEEDSQDQEASSSGDAEDHSNENVSAAVNEYQEVTESGEDLTENEGNSYENEIVTEPEIWSELQPIEDSIFPSDGDNDPQAPEEAESQWETVGSDPATVEENQDATESYSGDNSEVVDDTQSENNSAETFDQDEGERDANVDSGEENQDSMESDSGDSEAGGSQEMIDVTESVSNSASDSQDMFDITESVSNSAETLDQDGEVIMDGEENEDVTESDSGDSGAGDSQEMFDFTETVSNSAETSDPDGEAILVGEENQGETESNSGDSKAGDTESESNSAETFDQDQGENYANLGGEGNHQDATESDYGDTGLGDYQGMIDAAESESNSAETYEEGVESDANFNGAYVGDEDLSGDAEANGSEAKTDLTEQESDSAPTNENEDGFEIKIVNEPYADELQPGENLSIFPSDRDRDENPNASEEAGNQWAVEIVSDPAEVEVHPDATEQDGVESEEANSQEVTVVSDNASSDQNEAESETTFDGEEDANDQDFGNNGDAEAPLEESEDPDLEEADPIFTVAAQDTDPANDVQETGEAGFGIGDDNLEPNETQASLYEKSSALLSSWADKVPALDEIKDRSKGWYSKYGRYDPEHPENIAPAVALVVVLFFFLCCCCRRRRRRATQIEGYKPLLATDPEKLSDFEAEDNQLSPEDLEYDYDMAHEEPYSDDV